MPCPNDPIFEVANTSRGADPYDVTQSCEEHVGLLLGSVNFTGGDTWSVTYLGSGQRGTRARGVAFGLGEPAHGSMSATDFAVRERHAHTTAECAVAALRDAGLLHEEAIGYAVVRSWGNGRPGEWSILTQYDVRSEIDARATARLRRYDHDQRMTAPAALYLLPERTESQGEHVADA